MSTSEDVAIIGLTGGIATGKSTVSEMLRQLGVRVIDADIVAREVVEPGSDALDEIRTAFGDDVIAADGSLDRAALGELVFGDQEARARLNAITHPRIGLRMLELATEAGREGRGWVVYDAALLVENQIYRALAGLVVVACSEASQRARLASRDGFDEQQVEERIASQLPLADKVAVADWVIDNDGSLGETRAQVESVFRELVDRYGPAERG